MATLKELKLRIGSVASSEKITGAMKMISSAKVHKSELSLRKLLPFKDQLKSIMSHILASGENFASPLTAQRDVKRLAVVIFGSDDGLCGAYNINIFKAVLVRIRAMREQYGSDVDITVIPVGRKMINACKKLPELGIHLTPMKGVDSKMEGEKVNDFTLKLQEAFLNGTYDMVKVEYMRFFSMSRQRVTEDQLFPVDQASLLGENTNAAADNKMYLFEPNPNAIFNEVLPMFVLSNMQEIAIENRTSEQAARVMAMQSANDNAKKLQEELQLEYNKLRQQSITTELLDIVGGQVRE